MATRTHIIFPAMRQPIAQPHPLDIARSRYVGVLCDYLDTHPDYKLATGKPLTDHIESLFDKWGALSQGGKP